MREQSVQYRAICWMSNIKWMSIQVGVLHAHKNVALAVLSHERNVCSQHRWALGWAQRPEDRRPVWMDRSRHRVLHQLGEGIPPCIWVSRGLCLNQRRGSRPDSSLSLGSAQLRYNFQQYIFQTKLLHVCLHFCVSSHHERWNNVFFLSCTER